MSIDRYVRSLSLPLPEDILKRKWAGDLEGAVKAIDLRLEGELPQMLRDRLVCEKERIRRLPTQYPFNREQALELGLTIIDLAKNKYKKGAAIRIVEDNTVIFEYKMETTNPENDWWMGKKLAVSLQTGTSSLRAYVEGKTGLRKPFWEARPENYAACGGCFPVIMESGEIFARVLVSGMDHEEDHQIIADAMAMQLQKEIPSLI